MRDIVIDMNNFSNFIDYINLWIQFITTTSRNGDNKNGHNSGQNGDSA